MLRRSASGISALHLFYGVDLMVLCEGRNGELPLPSNIHTLDTAFWAKVVECFFQGSIRAISYGSKSQISSIAKDIAENKIGNTVVCFDRDFDDLKGVEIDHYNVLYTYGYSWENDAYNKHSIYSMIYNFLDNAGDRKNIIDKLENEISEFNSKVAKYIEYDISFVSKGKSGLFPRDKPLKFIELSGKNPRLAVDRINKELNTRGYKRGPKSVVKMNKSDCCVRLFGKMWARYSYHLTMSIMSDRARLDYESFSRIIIGYFCDNLLKKKPDDIEKYYRNAVSSIKL